VKYPTPDRFRTALEDRLRARARDRQLPVARLRKEVVFDRLLARLLVVAPDRWILKGGLALDYRLGERARTTKDMDVGRQDTVEASTVHGDVELTHLRQDNMTLLFQAVRTWRVLSSLVDAERRGRQAGSRGVKLTWRSLGQISLALTQPGTS